DGVNHWKIMIERRDGQVGRPAYFMTAHQGIVISAGQVRLHLLVKFTRPVECRGIDILEVQHAKVMDYIAAADDHYTPMPKLSKFLCQIIMVLKRLRMRLVVPICKTHL